MTFPIAFRFFAHWFTLGLGSLAVSYAMRLFADSNTFWAIKHFTSFIWAFNFAFWFFAFNIADSVLWFGTAGVAFWGLADWIADSWAMWVIAFP